MNFYKCVALKQSERATSFNHVRARNVASYDVLAFFRRSPGLWQTCDTQNKLIDLKKEENKGSIFWEVSFSS